MAFGDAHGDMACRESINALEKHIEEFKPQHRICLGDFFDFRALRKGIGNDESDAYDNSSERYHRRLCGWIVCDPQYF